MPSNILSNLKDYEKEKESFVLTIKNETKEYLSNFSSINTLEKIEEEIEIVKNKIIELKLKVEKYSKIIKKIEVYEQYKNDMIKYQEWKDKLNMEVENENIYNKKYTSALMLKDKISKAESISMINIIDSINNYAQIFLDDFFPDNPITIRLQPFKETKKVTKPQINLEIDYKGMSFDISSLSGGEISRVILAFTLSLAQMFNLPFIMIDECTSSLDQEMNSIVVESIKNNFTDKLAIMIAHQGTEGMYDRIVQV